MQLLSLAKLETCSEHGDVIASVSLTERGGSISFETITLLRGRTSSPDQLATVLTY